MVLITGASRGIGLAVAHALAPQRPRLVLVARNKDRLDQAAHTLREAHPDTPVTRMVCDLADPAAIRRLVGDVGDEVGEPAVLINNAGLYKTGKAETADLAVWDAMLDLNLRAAMHLTRLLLPDMLAEGSGAIVNIGSIAGKQGFPYNTAYCASKFGLVGFTHALFEEVRGRGVRVCAINPGFVATEMTRKVPAGRDAMLRAEDVAAAVRYVLSCCPGVAPLDLVLHPDRDPVG